MRVSTFFKNYFPIKFNDNTFLLKYSQITVLYSEQNTRNNNRKNTRNNNRKNMITENYKFTKFLTLLKCF